MQCSTKYSQRPAAWSLWLQGERAERAQERHAELQDIKTSRKKAKKVSVAKH